MFKRQNNIIFHIKYRLNMLIVSILLSDDYSTKQFGQHHLFLVVIFNGSFGGVFYLNIIKLNPSLMPLYNKKNFYFFKNICNIL